jgi:hypothetical protein
LRSLLALRQPSLLLPLLLLLQCAAAAIGMHVNRVSSLASSRRTGSLGRQAIAVRRHLQAVEAAAAAAHARRACLPRQRRRRHAELLLLWQQAESPLGCLLPEGLLLLLLQRLRLPCPAVAVLLLQSFCCLQRAVAAAGA